MSLLNIKGIFFFPGIILSLGWTVLNFMRISDYVAELKVEFPTCTATNPNKALICISTVLVMVIGRAPLERVFTSIFDKYLPTRKFPINTTMRHQKAEMLAERIFKIIVNIFCLVCLYAIMGKEDCEFLDKRVGGLVERPLYYNNYPC